MNERNRNHLTLLSLLFSFSSFADTVKPVIDNSKADKKDSCWVVEVQEQSIFVDVTTASDDSSSLGNGLMLVASPALPQGGAAVDTRFQGTTTVTYTATDPSGNVSTQCIDYVVRDYIGQGSFGFYGEEDTVIMSVLTPFISTMKFRDSFDGDLTDSIWMTLNVFNLQIGVYWAKYSVTNSKGQQFEKITTVYVVDNWAPIINSKLESLVKILVNSIYDPIDYIFITDNYDTPTSLRDSLVILSDDLDITTPGLYSTTFQTKDRSNNHSNKYTLHTNVVETLNTSNIQGKQFVKVYPNPVRSLLYVETTENLTNTDISLLDALGREMHAPIRKTSNGYVANVFELSAGIYSVEIRSGSKVQREKVLVN